MQVAHLLFEDEVLTDAIGTCSHCHHSPVAQSAPTCPRCGGADPFVPRAGFFRSLAQNIVLLVVIVAVVVGVVLAAIFGLSNLIT